MVDNRRPPNDPRTLTDPRVIPSDARGPLVEGEPLRPVPPKNLLAPGPTEDDRPVEELPADDVRAPRGITASDIDPNGNVVVYDHGPVEPEGDDVSDEDRDAYQAEHKEWHRQHGDGPVSIVMSAPDAHHAMAVEPTRYLLEPGNFDDGAIDAKIEEIRTRRTEAEDGARARADDVQLAADRKQAIAELRTEARVAATSERANRQPGAQRQPIRQDDQAAGIAERQAEQRPERKPL